MTIRKRILFMVAILVLFTSSAIYTVKIVKVGSVTPELIYRSEVDSATFNEVVKQEQLTRVQERRETITLGDYIVACCSAILGIIGVFKYFDEKREKVKRDSLADVKNIVTQFSETFSKELGVIKEIITDQTDREAVKDEIDKFTNFAIHTEDSSELKILIGSLGERVKKFVDQTMVTEMSADDFDCAKINIDMRSREAQRQILDMNFTREFKDAFLVIQAENTTALIRELQHILDDRMRNHKYLRYGKACTEFTNSYIRDLIKAHRKYNQA